MSDRSDRPWSEAPLLTPNGNPLQENVVLSDSGDPGSQLSIVLFCGADADPSIYAADELWRQTGIVNANVLATLSTHGGEGAPFLHFRLLDLSATWDAERAAASLEYEESDPATSDWVRRSLPCGSPLVLMYERRYTPEGTPRYGFVALPSATNRISARRVDYPYGYFYVPERTSDPASALFELRRLGTNTIEVSAASTQLVVVERAARVIDEQATLM